MNGTPTMSDLATLTPSTRRTRLNKFKLSQEWVDFQGENVQVIMFDASTITARKRDGKKIHISRNTIYDASPGGVQ